MSVNGKVVLRAGDSWAVANDQPGSTFFCALPIEEGAKA
jgi:hypothetical protein